MKRRSGLKHSRKSQATQERKETQQTNLKRPAHKEVRKTARSLEKSLQSAQQGLSLLLRSLQQSGFAEALHSYQQLQMVLIQQRLWARNHRREELNRHWRQIATTANEIHQILAPFSSIMGELKAIDTINAVSKPNESSEDKTPSTKPTDIPATPADNPETGSQLSLKAKVNESIDDAKLSALANALLPSLAISHHFLSRPSQNQDRSLQIDDIRSLLEAGLLEQHGWGKSKSYQATPMLQKRLLTDLTEALKLAEVTNSKTTPNH